MEKINEHLNIRIPAEIKEHLERMCHAEGRSKMKMSAILIKEYTPIKMRMLVPFSLNREISIGGTQVKFEPDQQQTGIIVTISDLQGQLSLPICKQDKAQVYDLISNLLLFVNSI